MESAPDTSRKPLNLTKGKMKTVSMRVKIGIDDETKHPGGVNIFGRSVGNHDQDMGIIHMAFHRTANSA